MDRHKRNSYPTLNYFADMGIDITIPIQHDNHREMQKYIDNLSDYDLKYYHNKILKLPISMYDKNGVKDAIGNRATKETIQYINEYELIDKEEYQRESNKRLFIKIILAFYIAFLVYVGITTLSVCWRCNW